MTQTYEYSTTDPTLRLDLELPSAEVPAGGFPCIIWVHGGGWRMQDRTARPDFARYFAAAGFAMVSIDYRLAPLHRHPAQVLDLEEAIRWIRAHADTLQIDPERIGLWGSSAGGHIANFAALSAAARCSDGDGGEGTRESAAVTCVVSGYAPTDIADLLPSPGSTADRSTTPEEDLLGGPAQSDDENEVLHQRAHEASPTSLPLGGPLPAFFLLHGTEDTMVPSSHSEKLYEALDSAGAEVLLYLIEGFGHGFFNPGDVQELGPGVRLDNGRLKSDPEAAYSSRRSRGFDPGDRPASFELVQDFFTHHLGGADLQGQG